MTFEKRKEAQKKASEVRKINYKKKILESDFDDLGYNAKRYRLLLEQNYACNSCNLDKWLEKSIPLELEHIDGNTENNNKENLILLCPNCHAQTPTWRRKNLL